MGECVSLRSSIMGKGGLRQVSEGEEKDILGGGIHNLKPNKNRAKKRKKRVKNEGLPAMKEKKQKPVMS